MSRRQKSLTWYAEYIKKRARQVWGWSPERKKALKRAFIGKDERGNELWRCERCDAQPLRSKERDVDHIIEVEAVGVWDGWDAYFFRLLDVKAEGLQVLCKPCHRPKTTENNSQRRIARKAKKDVI